jgi:hypothetical protein
MGRIELDYEPRRNRFRLYVTVEVPQVQAEAIAHMVLDTGTSRSAISAKIASDLGLDIGRLEMADAGGVTAVERRPRLPNAILWLVGRDVARVTLSDILVLTEIRRKEKRGKGGLSRRPETSMEAPSLFGMDALRALKGRAILDPEKGEGWIEW